MNEGSQPTLSPSRSAPPAISADAFDPELAALPGPPKVERGATLLLLAVTALASVAMVVTLARDAAYAFASSGVTELGDLRVVAPSALASLASVAPSSYARGSGMLGGGGAIRFERSFESDTFRLAPVAGRPDIWVELRVPGGVDPERYVPPTSFAGRLVRFDASGPRQRGLAQSVTQLTGQPVVDGAWLLVDGEAPAQSRWAVALVVLFAGFAAWNALAIGRLARKVE